MNSSLSLGYMSIHAPVPHCLTRALYFLLLIPVWHVVLKITSTLMSGYIVNKSCTHHLVKI